MFRSINRNPGAIRADLSEISRSVSQVYEGYRCSAIRTRFASNEDKCILPTFHLWPFLLWDRDPFDILGNRNILYVWLLINCIIKFFDITGYCTFILSPCKVREISLHDKKNSPRKTNVITPTNAVFPNTIFIEYTLIFWWAEYRRNIRKCVAYGSTHRCVSGTWQFMPRIFDVTSERSTSPAPSPLSLIAQFVCFTGGVLCLGKKPTGHYIPDASLLRISFSLSQSLSFSLYIAQNIV